MDLSLFLAQLLGVVFVVIGLGFALNSKHWQKMYLDIIKDSKCVFMSGLAAIVIGMAVVLNHNIWIADWPVVITIFGWAGVIKGAYLILFPNTLKVFKDVFKSHTLMVLAGIFYIALGVILGYFGFFA